MEFLFWHTFDIKLYYTTINQRKLIYTTRKFTVHLLTLVINFKMADIFSSVRLGGLELRKV